MRELPASWREIQDASYIKRLQLSVFLLLGTNIVTFLLLLSTA